MKTLKAQFFLMYAVAGAVAQLLPLYLERERGLSKTDVGHAMAIANAAVFFAPAICAWLADAHLSTRRILALIYVALFCVIGGLVRSHTATFLFAFAAAQQVLFAPIVPLQDGLVFRAQTEVLRRGETPKPYQKLRVWGTIGFIFPTLVFWPLLERGMPLTATLIVGMAFCVLAFLNTFLLPDNAQPEAAKSPGVPTLVALKVFLRRPILLFAISTFIGNAGIAAWATYFPVYLEEKIGVPRPWVAPLNNLGVVFEIFWMLGLGPLRKKIGLRGVMIAGALAATVRIALLVGAPSVGTVIATQLLHGIIVLWIFVAPPIFLNEHAEDSYRASMQGIHATLIAGFGRVAGNWFAGPIAEKNLLLAFAGAAGLCAVSACLLPFAFGGKDGTRESQNDAQSA